jgi:hypothetical protein
VVLMTGLPVTDDDHVPPGAAILQKPFTFEQLRSALPPGALAGGSAAGAT